MKSHLYKVLLGLFAFALFLPSCKETNEVEEPTLDVSETALVVAKDAVEKVVTIQTNQTAWSYSSPQEGDWITLTQEGNSLRIKVAANDKGVERFGVVLVSAGVQKRITVTQSAGDAVLTLDTEKLELSAKGGTEKIGYTSNKGKATVEIPADATWIKVNSLTDNSLSLAIEANTTKDARSAKVVLTAGTTSKEIEVAQEGKLYFVLPIVNELPSLANMLEFEKARGSHVVQTPDGFLNPTGYVFVTQSEFMPVIEYNYASTRAKAYTVAGAFCEKGEELTSAEFEAFMTGKGFTKKSATVYKLTAGKFEYTATVTVATDKTGTLIVECKESQPQAFATFKNEVLKEQRPWLGNYKLQILPKKNNTEVDAWEKEKGSEVSRDLFEQERYVQYKVKDSDEQYRAYAYIKAGGTAKIPADSPYVNGVSEAQAIFNETTLAYWIDSSGEPQLTNEVIEYFETKLGAKFYRKNGVGRNYFYNKEQKMAYAVIYSKNVHVEGETVLVVAAFLIQLDDAASAFRPVRSAAEYGKVLKARQDVDKLLESARLRHQ